jgi:hypothetical protein
VFVWGGMRENSVRVLWVHPNSHESGYSYRFPSWGLIQAKRLASPFSEPLC